MYDFFFSTPISELSEYDFKNLRNVLSLFDNDKTFIELLSSETVDKPSDYYLNKDLNAIDNSKELIVIIPAKTCSSLLIEVGYAIAKNKPITFFVKDRRYLPFLLKDKEVVLFNDYNDLTEKLFQKINKKEPSWDTWPNSLEAKDLVINEKPTFWNKVINFLKVS